MGRNQLNLKAAPGLFIRKAAHRRGLPRVLNWEKPATPKIRNVRASCSLLSRAGQWQRVSILPEMPRTEWAIQNNQWRNIVQACLACTSFADHQVGRVLNALRALEVEP
jgi:arylsulfatase A-like enzyme